MDLLPAVPYSPKYRSGPYLRPFFPIRGFLGVSSSLKSAPFHKEISSWNFSGNDSQYIRIHLVLNAMQNNFLIPERPDAACDRARQSSATFQSSIRTSVRRAIPIVGQCRFAKRFVPVLLACLLSGCKSNQSEIFTLPPDHARQRQIETRLLETDDETLVQNASIGVLQKIGYVFTDTSNELGIITAMCRRKADDSNVKAFFATILTALEFLIGGSEKVPYENEQYILVSIVTRKEQNGVLVRTTFARRIFFNNGHSYTQRIVDPEIYDAFYKLLSQSVFPTETEIPAQPSSGELPL